MTNSEIYALISDYANRQELTMDELMLVRSIVGNALIEKMKIEIETINQN